MKESRAGLAHCVVSAGLYEGKLGIHSIRICRSAAEAQKLVRKEEGEMRSNHVFAAEIWIEETEYGQNLSYSQKITEAKQGESSPGVGIRQSLKNPEDFEWECGECAKGVHGSCYDFKFDYQLIECACRKEGHGQPVAG